MMKDNMYKLKEASREYRLNNQYELTKNVLGYIQDRIKANESEIRNLINLQKEDITYEDIFSIINKEIEEDDAYKRYAKLKINQDKFLSTCIAMPIGVIAIEVYNTQEVIKWYIRAIKSRNAVAISDVEYAEDNVKSLILLIIKEALKKFEISENLIMILPYDECFYEYFDKVIYTYDDVGNHLEVPKTEEKEKTEERYVYLEDDSFQDEAIKNRNAIIVTGNIEEVIENINKKKTKGAVIYTKDVNKAYTFINLVNSENVFVNANLENIQDTIRKDKLLYEYKNMIIPIPQEVTKELMHNSENDENDKSEEKALVIKEEGILGKIKEFLRKLFK